MKNLVNNISPSELQQFYNSKGMYSMTIDACSRVLQYLKEDKVSQLIFDFGIDKLQYLVELLEDMEEYETLAMVRDKLNTHNKLTEENYNIKNGN